jgi:1-aminocyclopropane-1-carboxylate deaminase
MLNTSNSVLQPTSLPELNKRGIQLFVKRDDLIHKYISGNKWRKLKFPVLEALQQKKNTLLTFGGAYSNHLLATAAVANEMGLQSIGMVRGEELHTASNEVLKRCAEWNMQLFFVSREEYQQKDEWDYLQMLRSRFPSCYIIPEGGAQYASFIGCQELLQEVVEPFNHLFLASGTTTTACGLLLGLKAHQLLHVVPALKGFQTMNSMRELMTREGISEEVVKELLPQVVPHESYHFGGYGKGSETLYSFMEDFYQQTNIPLDPIYTGKALFALMDWIQLEDIHDASILFLHTGGVYAGKEIESRQHRKWSGEC